MLPRYNNDSMDLESDPRKSVANKGKHGIDFVEAKALWEDPDLVEVPALTRDESRFVVIGKIGQKHWSAAVTRRGDRTRIISVRRSRNEEVEIYEG
jgi:uncharacterized DUF497 family protein